MTQNSKAQVFPLFPTPLYVTSYEGDTTEIIKYFDSCEMNPGNEAYGAISKNTYVIEHPVCRPLSEFIMDCFKDYATNIMRYKYQDLQFAQSWLTYKEKGQAHKVHTHPNTLLSAVFYYDHEPGDSAICFSKVCTALGRSYLEPSLLEDFQDYMYAQEQMYFYPVKNNLIIFPSWLLHGVPPSNVDKVRKALGVNALTKGTFGDQQTVSEIIFGRYA